MLTSMQVLLKIWCPASNSVHRVKQHTLCQWAQPTWLRNLERKRVNELSLNPNWKYFLLTAYLGTLSKISFPMGGWMNRYKGRGKILGTKRHTFLVTTISDIPTYMTTFLALALQQKTLHWPRILQRRCPYAYNQIFSTVLMCTTCRYRSNIQQSRLHKTSDHFKNGPPAFCYSASLVVIFAKE